MFATSCLENGDGEGEGGTLPQMRNKAGGRSEALKDTCF